MSALERSCKGCGDWALCFDGYCGECAPASSVGSYVAWWNEHHTGPSLMPIGFFDDVVKSGDQVAGQEDENDAEIKSACLVILHSTDIGVRNVTDRPLHSSLIYETFGGVDDLYD
jgi:hypothetical protein